MIDVLDKTDGLLRVSAKFSTTYMAIAELLLCLCLFSCLFFVLKPDRLKCELSIKCTEEEPSGMME